MERHGRIIIEHLFTTKSGQRLCHPNVSSGADESAKFMVASFHSQTHTTYLPLSICLNFCRCVQCVLRLMRYVHCTVRIYAHKHMYVHHGYLHVPPHWNMYKYFCIWSRPPKKKTPAKKEQNTNTRSISLLNIDGLWSTIWTFDLAKIKVLPEITVLILNFELF